jgi:hypothetical protein
VLRLNENDFNVLNKVMQYSKNAYEEAIAAKESAIRTELAINEFIKEWNSERVSVDCDDKISGKKKTYWYTVSMFMTELLFSTSFLK